MTNWQLIITLATLVFAIFGANWLNLQKLKSYIGARFDTLKAELATLRAEVQGGHSELRGDIAAHRAETRHLAEKVERLDRQMEALYRPVLPGSVK
ncbi:MAG: hypothetical protein SF097_09660 [Acidobacteriota bacterium]|nr:hypothetical protein [Acidobacteriota bacterium]